MGFKPQYPLEQINQRKECRVLSVLRTATFPPHMWLVGSMLFQYLDQSGLSDTGITRE
jgi:hypothetical protein